MAGRAEAKRRKIVEEVKERKEKKKAPVTMIEEPIDWEAEKEFEIAQGVPREEAEARYERMVERAEREKYWWEKIEPLPEKRRPRIAYYKEHPEAWEAFKKESYGFRDYFIEHHRKEYEAMKWERKKQESVDKMLSELEPKEREKWQEEIERREKIFAENVPSREAIRKEEEALYEWTVKYWRITSKREEAPPMPATPYLDAQEADILKLGLKQTPVKKEIIQRAGTTGFLDLDRLSSRVQYRLHEIIDKELDTDIVLTEYRKWVDEAARDLKPLVSQWTDALEAKVTDLNFPQWLKQNHPKEAGILDRTFRENLPSYIRDKYPEIQEGVTVVDILPEIFKTVGKKMVEYRPEYTRLGMAKVPIGEKPKPWWQKVAEKAYTVFSVTEPYVRTAVEYGPFGVGIIKKAWTGLQTAFEITDEPFSAWSWYGDISFDEARGRTLTPEEGNFKNVYEGLYGVPEEVAPLSIEAMKAGLVSMPGLPAKRPPMGRKLPTELKEAYEQLPEGRSMFYEIVDPVWFIPVAGLIGAGSKALKALKLAKAATVAEKIAKGIRVAEALPGAATTKILKRIIKKPAKAAAFDINRILTKEHHQAVQQMLKSEDWLAKVLRKAGGIKPINKLIRFITPSSGHLSRGERIVQAYYMVDDSIDSLVTLFTTKAGLTRGVSRTVPDPARAMTKLFKFTQKEGNWYKGTMPAGDWLEKVNRRTLTKVQREFLEAADKLKASFLENYLMNGGKKFGLKSTHWPRIVLDKEGFSRVFIGGREVGIFRPASTRGRVFDEMAQGIADNFKYAHPYDSFMLTLRSLARSSNTLILQGRFKDYMHSLGKHLPIDEGLIKARTMATSRVRGFSSMDKFLNRALLRATGGKQISAKAFPLQRKKILARFPDLDLGSPEAIQKVIKATKDAWGFAQKESADLAKQLASARKVYTRRAFVELSMPNSGFQNIKLPAGEVEAITNLLKKDPRGNLFLRGLTNFNDFARFMQAGYDLGLGNLHLLPMMFTTPHNWARAMGKSIQTMLRPQIMDDVIRANSDTILEMIEKAGMNPLGTPEYMRFLRGKGGVLKKGPLGWLTSAFEREFGSGLFYAQLLDYKTHRGMLKWAYKADWEKHLPELGAAIDKRLGTMNISRLGLTASRRRIEGSLFYAPRYLRSFLGVLNDAVRGGVRSAVAVETLSGIAAAYLTTQYVACKALGQEPRLDPSRGDFLSFDLLNGTRVAMGGNFRWMMRTIASLVKGAQENPESFLKFNKEDIRSNPLIRGVSSKFSVIAGLGMDLWTGKTFLGEPITRKEVWMTEIPDTLLPFWVDWEYMENKTFPVRPRLTIGEFFGLQHYKISDWSIFEKMANTAIKGEIGQTFGFADKDWRDLTRQERAVLYHFEPKLTELRDKLQKKRKEWFPEDRFNQYFSGLDEIAIYYESQFAALERRTKQEIVPEAGRDGWVPSCGGIYRDERGEIRYSRNGEYNRLAEDYADVIKELDELKEREGTVEVTANSLVRCLEEYERIIRFADDLEYPKDDPLRPGEYMWDLREERVVYLADKYGKSTYALMLQIIEQQRDQSITRLEEACQLDIEYLANTIWSIEFPEGDRSDPAYREALQATYDQRDVMRITDPYMDALYNFWGYGADFDGLRSKDAVDLYLLHCQILDVDEPKEVKLASGVLPKGKQWIPVELIKASFEWTALSEEYADDKAALREARLRFRLEHKDWNDFVYGSMPSSLERLVD